jgi:hypothetical protein
MSTREEIKDGVQFDILRRGIVYTEVLGWIDMGHARGSISWSLKASSSQGSVAGNLPI